MSPSLKILTKFSDADRGSTGVWWFDSTTPSAKRKDKTMARLTALEKDVKEDLLDYYYKLIAEYRHYERWESANNLEIKIMRLEYELGYKTCDNCVFLCKRGIMCDSYIKKIMYKTCR